jgi:hypothetical protein
MKNYGHVNAAVRELTDDFKLVVVVEGSPNSLTPTIGTHRHKVIEVNSMPREMIESIPELHNLVQKLKKNNLDEVVWKVLGGSPAKYLKLQELTNDCLDDAVFEVVKSHLLSALNEARETVDRSSTNTKRLVELFRAKKVSQLPIVDVYKNVGNHIDYYTDKVFTEVEYHIQPFESGVELIIQKNISSEKDVFNLVNNLCKK